MSCNGCRVLRKGCSDACVLRHCLRCIDSPEAQANATLFVTKFFGRAGLTGFINGVSENQRPALFQSLLYEACGRTVNPVYGAVGLLFSGNWAVCQAAVETVLTGGSPKPAAIDVSKNLMKPKSTAALHDHPAGSLSSLDHPAGFNISNSVAFNKHMNESSLATSTGSFKANSLHATPNHCVLDFSNYSGSSSAEEMIRRPHINKRSRYCKPVTIVGEEPMIKRPRSSFLYASSAGAAGADPCDAALVTARRPSITTWIAGYNKANCVRILSNDCTINYDVDTPAGRGMHVVQGEEIKQATKDVVANRLAMQGTHEKLVAPIARRVYIAPQMKQVQEKYAQEKKLSKENDEHEAQHDIRSGREEYAPSLSCSVHQDTSNIKLDLSLQAQPGHVCCDDDELVDINIKSPHDTQLKLIKHEELHVLLRMSSPSSVNSEGSVNTLVGCLDASSCTAFESPKDGFKLLNLLL